MFLAKNKKIVTFFSTENAIFTVVKITVCELMFNLKADHQCADRIAKYE